MKFRKWNLTGISIALLQACATHTAFGGPFKTVFPTNIVQSSPFAASNLVTFTPFIPLADMTAIAATNGIECFLNIDDLSPQGGASHAFCMVSVFNHSTNHLGCLDLPATNICRVALLDSQGREVEKTALGRKYGQPLSETAIDRWRHERHPGRNIFKRMITNGDPNYADMPTTICAFKINDVFNIKASGEYELHVQIWLVQMGLLQKDGQ